MRILGLVVAGLALLLSAHAASAVQRVAVKDTSQPTSSPRFLYHSALLSNLVPEHRKPPVVLIHGLLGSSRNFHAFAKTLYNDLQGRHDIVVLDLVCHGRSAALGSVLGTALGSELGTDLGSDFSDNTLGYPPLTYDLMAEDVRHTLQVSI